MKISAQSGLQERSELEKRGEEQRSAWSANRFARDRAGEGERFKAWVGPRSGEFAASGGSSGRFAAYGGEIPEEPEDDRDEDDQRPRTEWLPKLDVTELLSAPKADVPGACYLEWESAERPCRIALQADMLVIGRSRDAAQHVDETSGVSRAHLEMLLREGRWSAKDLGSRNGSWLNGNPMAPYEAYPLDAGDCLQVAGSIYRFHAPT